MSIWNEEGRHLGVWADRTPAQMNKIRQLVLEIRHMRRELRQEADVTLDRPDLVTALSTKK